MELFQRAVPQEWCTKFTWQPCYSCSCQSHCNNRRSQRCLSNNLKSAGIFKMRRYTASEEVAEKTALRKQNERQWFCLSTICSRLFCDLRSRNRAKNIGAEGLHFHKSFIWCQGQLFCLVCNHH